MLAEIHWTCSMKLGSHNQLELQTIKMDLYRLLSILLADHFMGDHLNQDDPLIGLRSAFCESEAVRLLISSAIMVRTISQGSKKTSQLSCGKLIPDLETGKIVNLSLNDGCDKIIHCTHFSSDGAETFSQKAGFMVMPEVMKMRGLHNKKGWHAYLNITLFIKAALDLFAKLEGEEAHSA